MADTNEVVKMFAGVFDESVRPAFAAYKLPPIAELTWVDIRKMDADQLREVRKHPEGRAKIDEILASRAAAAGVKADEAIAAQAAEEARVVAEEAAAAAGTTLETPVEVPAEAVVQTPEEIAAAAAEAETARLAAEAAVKKLQEDQAAAEAAEAAKVAAAAAVPKRFVYDFQARDEAGNPIGNRTHLEASSQEELDRKKEESYLNAVRAIDRLKKQKPTFRKEEPFKATTQEELNAAANDITSPDPAVRAEAVRKLAGAALEEQQEKARVAEGKAIGAAQSLEFLKSHILDYNNCEANNRLLSDYIAENNLEWTKENLEIAFGNLESQLAPVIQRQAATPVPVPTVDNPPVTVQPAATAQAVPAAVPAVTAAPATPAAAAPVAPVVPAPAAINTPAVAPARRPGVNAGLVPGQTVSGVAPVAKTPAQTRTELLKELNTITPDEMKRRHKIDPEYYNKVNAILRSKK